MPVTRSLNPVLHAAGWMLLSLVSFIGMAVAARQLSAHMSLFEILAIRSAIGLVILTPVVVRARGRILRTRRLALHVARNTVHFAGQYGWILGVALLPLAEVFALEFTQPVWATLLATVILGERLTASRRVSVAGGFIGVLIIVRPGGELLDNAALIVLGAALAFAASVIMVKSLTRTERAVTILFYMCLVQLPLGLIPALFQWVTPGLAEWPWLAIIGVAGFSAHYGLAKALTVADVTAVFPVDFLRLPGIAVVGYLLYGEPLSVWVFVGAAVIFGSNYYNLVMESRPVRAAPV